MQQHHELAPLDSERGDGRSTALQDLPKLGPDLETAMRASMPDAEPRMPSSRLQLLPVLSSGYMSKRRIRPKAAENIIAASQHNASLNTCNSFYQKWGPDLGDRHAGQRA